MLVFSLTLNMLWYNFDNLLQVNQAVGIKTEAELCLRRQSFLNEKGEGYTMGSLYWQLEDIWQAPTWASIGNVT